MLIMLSHMNDEIRQMVRIELLKKDIKQVDLADKLEVSKQYLSQLLLGKAGFMNPTWERIFDELSLKLIAVPDDEGRGDN